MTKPIKAKNLTAQLQYQGTGNPPTTHPHSAISNAFPGLEMDFRNVWRRILKGLQLHEASMPIPDCECLRRDGGSCSSRTRR
jgi:hypothetical protein